MPNTQHMSTIGQRPDESLVRFTSMGSSSSLPLQLTHIIISLLLKFIKPITVDQGPMKPIVGTAHFA